MQAGFGEELRSRKAENILNIMQRVGFSFVRMGTRPLVVAARQRAMNEGESALTTSTNVERVTFAVHEGIALVGGGTVSNYENRGVIEAAPPWTEEFRFASSCRPSASDLTTLIRDLATGDAVVISVPQSGEQIVVQFMSMKSGCPRLLFRSPKRVRIRHLQQEIHPRIIKDLIGG